MASIAEAVSRVVSVEEYLHTSYKPDRELIDGRLEEKPKPTMLHGFVQSLLSHWFLNHMEQWGTLAMSEARTRVCEACFRLPDIAVVLSGTKLLKTIDFPPLIAIEIMSEDDTFASLRDRATDFSLMGTENIWLVDPQARRAYAFDGADWRSTEALAVAGSPIHLDLAWLWARVEEQI